MKANAAGQLLGYSLQFPRALCHLLQMPTGGSVGVEVLGDVTTFFPEGIVLTEEDKSSVGSNPLTDRSSNLWKTFYNWIIAVQENDLELEQTRFVLYCNQSGKKSLVNQFHSVQSENDALNAIQNTKVVLDDLGKDHIIWKYFDYVVNQHGEIFTSILQQFELKIGKDSGYDDVKTALEGKLVPEYCIEYLMDHLGGWLQKKINEMIAKGDPALVSFDEFNKSFQTFFRNIRQQSLVDWASINPPSDADVSSEIKIRPTYIRQLDFISLPDDEIVEAVSDYLKADTNRTVWIENGILDETTAVDFEKQLISYWKNKSREVSITENRQPDDKKGQLLFGHCQINPIAIRGEQPPHPTVQGTYHALADREDVGWHPDWKNLICKEGE